MKSIFKQLLFGTLLFSFCITLAQDNKLTSEYKEQVVNRLSQLINDHYVFPDLAEKTSKHILLQLEEGHFNAFEDNETFAEALTKSVQSVNNDKHMRIRANRPYVAPKNTPERMVEQRISRLNWSRAANYGFNTVRILDGNVGYIDLRGFAGLENAKSTADAAMKILSRTDAVIFDLTKNGGGSPRMVQYLCSFFFNEKTHLNSLYWREGDETHEFWTLDEIGGERMHDVPLFVMTSGNTFSGAEEFSYNMQTQKRATLIGQTTGGGANPGGTRDINEHLNVFIPTGTAINPITKTNWEGVGVVPEIKTSTETTLDKTIEMATTAAEKYRNDRKEKFTRAFSKLNNLLNEFEAEKSDELLIKELTACISINLFEEGDINALGYQYLLEHKKPIIAEAIFKANTKLFPDSANVYDSYAEALLMKGDLKSSLINYKKAVEVATNNNDRNLEFFKRNLETVKNKIEDKE